VHNKRKLPLVRWGEWAGSDNDIQAMITPRNQRKNPWSNLLNTRAKFRGLGISLTYTCKTHRKEFSKAKQRKELFSLKRTFKWKCSAWLNTNNKCRRTHKLHLFSWQTKKGKRKGPEMGSKGRNASHRRSSIWVPPDRQCIYI